MKKINNKGYMLVEIILAFSIAFVLIYFMMDLIVKLKNKNDDLMVETLVRTDQTIITNELMEYAIEKEKDFDCSSLTVSGNTVNYEEDVIDIVSEYAKIDKSNVSCSTDLGKVSIKIPIDVEQMKEEDFDVIIDYKYDIGDMTPPTCSLSVNGTTITATYKDPEGGSGIKYYGFNSDMTGENEGTKSITGVGSYTFYVVDNADNKAECKVDVEFTKKIEEHSNYKATAVYKYLVGSVCYCNTAEEVLTGSCASTDGTCKCSTGNGVTKYDTCQQNLDHYSCPNGGDVSGSQCVITTTTYKCDKENGYTKINNKYCYKIG